MLTRLFNNLSLQSGISAFITVFGLAVWVGLSSDLDAASTSLPGLDNLISPSLFKGFVIFSIPVISLIFNRLFNAVGVLKSSYHILVISGIQLLLFFYSSLNLSVLLMLWLVVFLYQKIFNLNNVGDPRPNIFSAGTLIGLSSLVVPESIFMLLLIWTALFVYRMPSIKNFVIPLLGIFSVYFLFFSAFFFLSEFDFVEFLLLHLKSIRFDITTYDLNKPLWLIPFLVSLIWAAYELVLNISKATVFKRQILTLGLSLITILFLIAPTLENSEMLLMLTVFPISILQANLILRTEKWWVQDLIYFLILTGLLLQIII
jgi:hypothetical protein